MNSLRIAVSFFLLGSLVPALATEHFVSGTEDSPPNVLFIAIDDLRPELGCYGSELAVTPHIDDLAQRGVWFDRAYTQQAVCAPARNTVMTGLRPDTLGITDLSTFFRDKRPQAVTLPEYFITQGYLAEAYGKIYHVSHGNQNDEQSWTAPAWTAGKDFYATDKNKRLFWENRNRQNQRKARGLPARGPNSGPSFEIHDAPDSEYADWKIAEKSLSALRRLSGSGRPFFLAVGFIKPHLPFVAPQRFWDLYPPERINLPELSQWPGDTPMVATNAWGELRNYAGIPATGGLDRATALNLIRGYYACISFVDAQIGRLMAELDALDLRDDTIVVLWSDHGFKLGEYGAWCKHTNFELDTRVPLIVSSPGLPRPGARSAALVELVDLYPTLCELAGLAVPQGLDGVSFVPQLEDPGRVGKGAVLSQFPGTYEDRHYMGYSVRTRDHRYTEWVDQIDGTVFETELYDLRTSALEIQNIAGRPEHSALLARLRDTLADLRQSRAAGGAD